MLFDVKHFEKIHCPEVGNKGSKNEIHYQVNFGTFWISFLLDHYS